jgi:TM2 domain-containing membrane protein YozV
MSSDVKKMMQFEANKKSTGVAYLLWFLFGMLGVHRFYLGYNGSGAAILILTLFSILLSFVGIGLVLIFIPIIWVFIDLFLIPGMAREYNNRLIGLIHS